MLPKAKAAKLDFKALAERMRQRKERLFKVGVPAVGKEAMGKASRGWGDSPAEAAKRNADAAQEAVAVRLDRAMRGQFCLPTIWLNG